MPVASVGRSAPAGPAKSAPAQAVKAGRAKLKNLRKQLREARTNNEDGSQKVRIKRLKKQITNVQKGLRKEKIAGLESKLKNLRAKNSNGKLSDRIEKLENRLGKLQAAEAKSAKAQKNAKAGNAKGDATSADDAKQAARNLLREIRRSQRLLEKRPPKTDPPAKQDPPVKQDPSLKPDPTVNHDPPVKLPPVVDKTPIPPTPLPQEPPVDSPSRSTGLSGITNKLEQLNKRLEGLSDRLNQLDDVLSKFDELVLQFQKRFSEAVEGLDLNGGGQSYHNMDLASRFARQSYRLLQGLHALGSGANNDLFTSLANSLRSLTQLVKAGDKNPFNVGSGQTQSPFVQLLFSQSSTGHNVNLVA